LIQVFYQLHIVSTLLSYMAEERGFEPLRRINDLLAFQASPFSLLGTPP
jgi:hypothetical protein